MLLNFTILSKSLVLQQNCIENSFQCEQRKRFRVTKHVWLDLARYRTLMQFVGFIFMVFRRNCLSFGFGIWVWLNGVILDVVVVCFQLTRPPPGGSVGRLVIHGPLGHDTRTGNLSPVIHGYWLASWLVGCREMEAQVREIGLRCAVCQKKKNGHILWF